MNTGPWTDEDLTELAKLMKKYPVGTTERWEKIAEALNRSVTEVTHFARKLKDNAFRYFRTNVFIYSLSQTFLFFYSGHLKVKKVTELPRRKKGWRRKRKRPEEGKITFCWQNLHRQTMGLKELKNKLLVVVAGHKSNKNLLKQPWLATPKDAPKGGNVLQRQCPIKQR